MKNKLPILSALAALAASVQAQVVFDNGPWGTPTGYERAYFETSFDPDTGLEFPTGSYRTLRQSFTTPPLNIVAGEIAVTIHADPHGAAYALLADLRDGAGTSHFQGFVDLVGGKADYTFVLPAASSGSTPTLDGSTRYYLTFSASGFGYNLDWFYAPTDSPEIAEFWSDDPWGGYQAGEYTGDFTLRIAVVPEPGQFALVGGLLLGGWGVLRRMRRRERWQAWFPKTPMNTHTLTIATGIGCAVCARGQVLFDNGPWLSSTPTEGAWNVPLVDPVTNVEYSDFRALRQSFTTPATDITASQLAVTLRLGLTDQAVGFALRIKDGLGTTYFENGWVSLVGSTSDYTVNLSALDAFGEPTAATLAANTQYFLSVEPRFTGDHGEYYAFGWFHAPTDSPEVADYWGFQWSPADGFGFPYAGQLAGDLTLRIAVVPEPGQFALIGALGLGAWAVVRCRGGRLAREPNRNLLAQQRGGEAQDPFIL